MSSMTEIFGEVISSYSRAQAIEDGVLIDVDAIDPNMRREVGMLVPIALTKRVFAEVVEVHPRAEAACQDIKGRLWDVLWMLRLQANAPGRARASRPSGGASVEFGMFCTLPEGPSDGAAKEITLRAAIGCGDDGSPVITIMWPDES